MNTPAVFVPACRCVLRLYFHLYRGLFDAQIRLLLRGRTLPRGVPAVMVPAPLPDRIRRLASVPIGASRVWRAVCTGVGSCCSCCLSWTRVCVTSGAVHVHWD